MVKTRLSLIALLAAVLTGLLSSCRGDYELIVPSTETQVQTGGDAGDVVGMYLLNEGNMGSNKATLDYLDFATGVYRKNIFSEVNPDVVFSLGDVGNDIGIYGDKLYAVINVSGLIEVMHAGTGRHIGQISLPNCRSIVFHEGKAYVTSYNGPVLLDPNARPGIVAEIDTATLAITRTTTVGYQPDGLAITGGRIYVANSGGYRVPNYDRTVSVVRLSDFIEENRIDVAPNLNLMLLAPDGLLYVSSRGNYADVAPDVFVLDPSTRSVVDTLGFAASSWWIDDGKIYVLGSDYNSATNAYTYSTTLYDTRSRQVLSRSIIPPTTLAAMQHPYGIAVHPATKEVYITDAANFVTPGTLHSFTTDGTKRWSTTTGDIPAHFAFSTKSLALPEADTTTVNFTEGSPYITRIMEYRPAPGQFVNTLPATDADDTPDSVNAKVLDIIGENRAGLITLGGYGGYVVVGFDHTIENRPDTVDFRIVGNAFTGSSEPGIVRVAYDRNRNGRPDADEWYEIEGSAHAEAVRGYTITYSRPTTALADCPWSDNAGATGAVLRNAFHSQEYYPLWLMGEDITFTGTLLPRNAVNTGTAEQQYWQLSAYEYGYADNADGQTDAARRTAFDIEWAVDAQGRRVSLPGADFIQIYTGVNQDAGWLGETSTEISNVIDLHLLRRTSQ